MRASDVEAGIAAECDRLRRQVIRQRPYLATATSKYSRASVKLTSRS
ncbi:MAG: hypothetical protein R2710_30470 [Acidimicrobiales bacterium]